MMRLVRSIMENDHIDRLMLNLILVSVILSCVTADPSTYIIIDIQVNMTNCTFTLQKSSDRIVIGPTACDGYMIGDVVCVYDQTQITSCVDNAAGRVAVYVIVAIVMAGCIIVIFIWVLNLRYNYKKDWWRPSVMVDINGSCMDENHIPRQCPICIEDLVENVCKVSCGHLYHRPCISPWLEINNTCPVCRNILG